ncbi:MAG: hypothetical protein VKL59_00765 [Nostocaceae cyanobacterium]|nr:hypothetical protein [Nostocaceae cyanobacterium]
MRLLALPAVFLRSSLRRQSPGSGNQERSAGEPLRRQLLQRGEPPFGFAVPWVGKPSYVPKGHAEANRAEEPQRTGSPLRETIKIYISHQ